MLERHISDLLTSIRSEPFACFFVFRGFLSYNHVAVWAEKAQQEPHIIILVDVFNFKSSYTVSRKALFGRS